MLRKEYASMALFEIYNSEITLPSIIYEFPVTLVC